MRRAYKRLALQMHPDKAAVACRFGTGFLPTACLVGDIANMEVCSVEVAVMLHMYKHRTLVLEALPAGIGELHLNAPLHVCRRTGLKLSSWCGADFERQLQ